MNSARHKDSTATARVQIRSRLSGLILAWPRLGSDGGDRLPGFPAWPRTTERTGPATLGRFQRHNPPHPAVQKYSRLPGNAPASPRRAPLPQLVGKLPLPPRRAAFDLLPRAAPRRHTERIDFVSAKPETPSLCSPSSAPTRPLPSRRHGRGTAHQEEVPRSRLRKRRQLPAVPEVPQPRHQGQLLLFSGLLQEELGTPGSPTLLLSKCCVLTWTLPGDAQEHAQAREQYFEPLHPSQGRF